MGVDTNLYIGPFATSNPAPMREVTTLVSDCPKCKITINHELAKFCSKCGSRLEERKISSMQRGDANSSAVRGHSEAMTAVFVGEFDDTPFWIPNVKTPGRQTHYSDGDDFAIKMNDIDLIKEKEVFAQMFADELAILERNVGDVTIRWGVVQYYT